MLRSLVGSLKATFKKHPLVANCIIYGSLYSGAEFSQQTLIRKVLSDSPEPYDFALVGRYAILGSTIFPTGLFYWYRWLDGRFTGTAAATIVKKVLLDQCVTVPPILTIFYVGMSVMEGRADIFTEWQQKFFSTFKSSCMFWMPAQAINFLLVPPSLRVVYIGSASFAWVNILCCLKRTASTTTSTE